MVALEAEAVANKRRTVTWPGVLTRVAARFRWQRESIFALDTHGLRT